LRGAVEIPREVSHLELIVAGKGTAWTRVKKGRETSARSIWTRTLPRGRCRPETWKVEAGETVLEKKGGGPFLRLINNLVILERVNTHC